MKKQKSTSIFVLCSSLLAFVSPLCVWGRGESWLPKPPAPPPKESLTNAARYVEWKWRMDVSDPSTGLDLPAIKHRVESIAAELGDRESWFVVKAKMYAAICDEMAIAVSPHDWYPAMSVWNRLNKPMHSLVRRRNSRIDEATSPEAVASMRKGIACGRWQVDKDFEHSIPEWDGAIKLGFAGMRERMLACRKDAPFYKGLEITADASLRLVRRLAEYARTSPDADSPRVRKQREAFEQLVVGAPRTAYEVLEFICLYYFMSEFYDNVQCRSLSVIDVTLWPYYQADLAAGRTTEAEFREQFLHFLWQWGSIDNYWGQPVTIGGTNADGTTAYNPLSRIVLDVLDEYGLPTPKVHVKIADNTPRDILDKLLDMARRQRSLSFCGEKPIRKVLMRYGATEDEARRFLTRGCYEYIVPEAGNMTDIGQLSIPYPIVELLSEAAAGTFDAGDYPAFEKGAFDRIVAMYREHMDNVRAIERHMDDVNPANLASLAVEYSVRTGRDSISTGSRRGNHSNIESAGFGTAVDMLLATKEIVYERKLMTLGELGALMARNWEGNEELRLRMRRSKRKWGNNDPDANAIGRRLAKTISAAVNDKPNSRGGAFRLSGHSARAFVILGAKTGATPDGRKAGEEISKNLSATMGADTEGVTALVNTLGSLDGTDFPGDFPLDVMLHPATAAGERGLAVMRTALEVYFDNGGTLMQFNVVSPEQLRDAQAHPEKYANLQVRVCGWSVRWNDLSKSEQDAYILRSEQILR